MSRPRIAITLAEETLAQVEVYKEKFCPKFTRSRVIEILLDDALRRALRPGPGARILPTT